ncbi:MAG TPA: hypothetical protein VG713_09025 [Pirellulales bacterium]|nr:hypothetical protein [Pirellulales bacterium]
MKASEIEIGGRYWYHTLTSSYPGFCHGPVEVLARKFGVGFQVKRLPGAWSDPPKALRFTVSSRHLLGPVVPGTENEWPGTGSFKKGKTMAKKATGTNKKQVSGTATAEKPAGPGLGKKLCPKCGEVIAARSMKHEACGWVGKAKKGKSGSGKKAATAKASVDRNGHDAVIVGSPAIAFIRAAGGLAQAKAALAELEALKGLL